MKRSGLKNRPKCLQSGRTIRTFSATLSSSSFQNVLSKTARFFADCASFGFRRLENSIFQYFLIKLRPFRLFIICHPALHSVKVNWTEWIQTLNQIHCIGFLWVLINSCGPLWTLVDSGGFRISTWIFICLPLRRHAKEQRDLIAVNKRQPPTPIQFSKLFKWL